MKFATKVERSRFPRDSAGRILVIDDSRHTAQSFVKALEAADYQTVIAYRGLDAVEEARKTTFDAVFVDVHLPDLNGLVVSQQLRQIMGPRVPIIVVSGDTSMEVINSLAHVGATHFFSKPFKLPHLMEHLKEWIAASRQEPA